MHKLIEWIRNVFTEPDNVTICPVRVLGVFSTLQGLGMSAFDVIVNHVHFDIVTFGTGVGAMLGALGVALGIKKDS